MAFYEKTPAFGRTASTAAIAFAVLLLLPAFGIAGKPDGNMVLQMASAQFITPDSQNTNVSSTQNASGLVLRGFIGGMIPAEDENATDTEGQTNQDDYIVVGRWRMFVNESLVHRFVANLTVARIDGGEHHSILIESIGERPEFVESTSRITTQIYTDGTFPSMIVPITLEINDKVLKITNIEIDERAMEGDDEQQDILRVIDGQSIYGIVDVQETR